jgi:hypothetical protein
MGCLASIPDHAHVSGWGLINSHREFGIRLVGTIRGDPSCRDLVAISHTVYELHIAVSEYQSWSLYATKYWQEIGIQMFELNETTGNLCTQAEYCRKLYALLVLNNADMFALIVLDYVSDFICVDDVSRIVLHYYALDLLGSTFTPGLLA